MNFSEIVASFLPKMPQEKGEFGFVYMFYANKTDKTPVYVGSTKNPSSRMANHFRKHSKPSPYGKLDKSAYDSITYIRIAFAGSAFDCRCIESQLISKYKPIYNSDFSQVKGTATTKNLAWASFTKDEFSKDSTVVYRCFAELLKRKDNELKNAKTTIDIYKTSWRVTA